MQVSVGAWAWLPKSDLSQEQIETLKRVLIVTPRKMGDHPGDPPKPIHLYRDLATKLGIPRGFFEARKRDHHVVTSIVTDGDSAAWPGPLKWTSDSTKSLREAQIEALDKVLSSRGSGSLGGIVQAVPGFGKTILACALIEKLQLPTLVVVHKEFLMKQWRKRLAEYLPGIKVGLAQEDKCEFAGNHVVMGMVHSLAGRDYPPDFYTHFGLCIFDEVHRVGSETWSEVPPKFNSRFRLGLSATPKRLDGAEAVFLNHIGPVIFKAKEVRMVPKIRRVFTSFKLAHTDRFNNNLIKKTMLLKFLTENRSRNAMITEQLILAVKTGRKVLVLSERLEHLNTLAGLLKAAFEKASIDPPSMDFYIGGRKEEEYDEAAECQVIFATSQLVTEGLDIPPLDTLFLTTPLGGVEQAVGRILRPYEGKKEAVVVDFRDDAVSRCKALGNIRDNQYQVIIGAAAPTLTSNE